MKNRFSHIFRRSFDCVVSKKFQKILSHAHTVLRTHSEGVCLITRLVYILVVCMYICISIKE